MYMHCVVFYSTIIEEDSSRPTTKISCPANTTLLRLLHVTNSLHYRAHPSVLGSYSLSFHQSSFRGLLPCFPTRPLLLLPCCLVSASLSAASFLFVRARSQKLWSSENSQSDS